MPDPVQDTRHWLDRVVVGLNLCPFAARPLRDNRVRITTSDADNEESLLQDLHRELLHIERVDGAETETTLLVITRILGHFEDYNQFLNLADALVVACGLEGRFQIASFHPHYRYEDVDANDRSNLTNRAPWPLLHILREDSVSDALARHPQPDDIYKQNIRALKALDETEIRALFYWLA